MDKNQDKKRKKRFYDDWFLEERTEFIEEETQEEIEKGEGEKEEVEKEKKEKVKDKQILQTEEKQEEEKTHYQEKRQKIFEKIKTLFKTQEGEADFFSEEKEDKPEDYKTYLEKQKQIQEKEEELEENSLPAKKLLKLEKIKENDKITLIKEQIKSLIAKVKKILKKLKEKIKKVTNKTTANITELYEEKENLSATSKLKELESEEEGEVSANSDLQKSQDSKKTKEDNLKETLKNLGIKADNLKDFDIFKKKEKKSKPSLAAVKVKRIKQENKLEKLEEDVALEQEKVKIENTVKTKDEKQETKQQEEERKQLKNKEKIEKLNQEFNKINRKQDKITLNKEEENDKIEQAFKEIKQTQEEVGKDHKDYTIKVENLDTEKNRRKEISKTTVEDVLKGSEDLFETDIDRVAKKLVLNRNSDIKEEEKHVSSEVEEFRKEVYKEKTSKNLVDNERKTNLDKLILDARIVENKNKTLNKEVEQLNENLKIIKEENEFKKELDREFEEEMSLEKRAKENLDAKDSKEEKASTPEREKSLKGYSDYHLDEKEIQELILKNKIESGAEKADIETLNKDMSIKKEEKDDIEKFKEEKMLPKKASKTVINVISTKRGSSKKEEQEEKDQKIEYKEKLYENEPNKFFDDGKEFIFGEYKTKDRGYRPVSREKMIQDKKKLDEIFQKYSNINIPVARNKEIEQKIKSPTGNVTKYRPTRLVSSVYGTDIPKNQGKNYFKEIASQEEVTWKIDVGSKTIKNKKKIKKSRKK